MKLKPLGIGRGGALFLILLHAGPAVLLLLKLAG